MKPLVLFGDTHLFPRSVLFKALSRARLKWIDGNGLREPVGGVLLAWEKYCTHDSRAKGRRAIPAGAELLNEHFHSGKDVIDAVHCRVFGYGLNVDPLTYRARGVRKSKKNARHDGILVDMPVAEPMPSKVYQRLVRNEHGGEVEDIRLCTLKGKPLICYRKRRPIAERFLNTLSSAAIVPVADMLTADELLLIESFCGEARMDYGALDILRDTDDGRIYIADANNTPRGPPKALSELESARALKIIGGAFAEFLGS